MSRFTFAHRALFTSFQKTLATVHIGSFGARKAATTLHIIMNESDDVNIDGKQISCFGTPVSLSASPTKG